MFLLFIDAISISNTKDVKEGGGGVDNENNEFSIKVLFIQIFKCSKVSS